MILTGGQYEAKVKQIASLLKELDQAGTEEVSACDALLIRTGLHFLAMDAEAMHQQWRTIHQDIKDNGPADFTG